MLMLVFSYKQWIGQIWDGWLTVSMLAGAAVHTPDDDDDDDYDDDDDDDDHNST